MGKSAVFLFQNSLNDFLPPPKKNWFSYPFQGSPSVKDAMEAIGVPHPEVGGIRVNGRWVNFSYQLQHQDKVEVFPLSSPGEALPPPSLLHSGSMPNRFILDVHLGKLARKLRMLGFDSLYENHWEDATIASIAAAEKRLVLSRDIGLLKHKSVEWGYWLRSRDPGEQLEEVIRFCQLSPPFHPFTRCIRCNGLIAEVPKQAVEEQVPSNTRQYFQEFYQCQSCKKIYWKGSHHERMQEWIKKVSNPIT